jgi:hypothetical protein
VKGLPRWAGVIVMQNLFAVPWLSASRRAVLSIVVALILVLGMFAALKISTGRKQAPSKELHTGSIQKSPALRRSSSDDPMAAFLSPELIVRRPIKGTAAVREETPLPRPRPKRL